MKNKIKARYEQLKHDHFSQGILVGGGVAIGTCLLFKLNFDGTNMYIPDAFIDHMRETGETMLARKGDATILLSVASSN